MTGGLGSIQPVVLVGGTSRRFGRDKLREPLESSPGSQWLVDRPIAALRAVFGPRVAAVGDCDPEVSARADLVIPDTRHAAGPIGGVLSALEQAGGDVFVLSGDLPYVTENAILAVLAAARTRPGALVVLAATDRMHPCIGLYRGASAEFLRVHLAAGRHSLFDAVPAGLVATAAIDPREAHNVNTPDALQRGPRG